MKYVDNTGTCLPCLDGKKYDNGINCVNICLDYQSLNTDGTCSLICPLRNQRWDPINHCVNCPAGYIADGHNNCVPAPTCPPGQVLDSNNNCVAKCTVDWEHYDATTNSCVQTCRANQQYINGQRAESLQQLTLGVASLPDEFGSCTDCPNGGMSDGNNGCLPGPTTPPLSCPAGFNLINNKCESYCPIWEKNNLLHPTLCDPICNRNTQYFDQTTYKCLDCPPGQISDGNNGCKDAPTTAPTPLVCTPGYALNSAGTACNSICPPWRQNNLQNPSKCDLRCPKSTHTYYDTTQFACMDCPNGGTTDDNNTCIAPTTTPPPPPPPPPIKQPPPTLPPTLPPIATASVTAFFVNPNAPKDLMMTYSVTNASYMHVLVTYNFGGGSTNFNSIRASSSPTTISIAGNNWLPGTYGLKYYASDESLYGNMLPGEVEHTYPGTVTIYDTYTPPPLTEAPPPPPPPTEAPCQYLDRSGKGDNYQQTCTNISNNNGIISANCQDIYQRYQGITAINSCNCSGRIQNINSSLSCDTISTSYYNPSTSYNSPSTSYAPEPEPEPEPEPAPYDDTWDNSWYGNTSSG
jgi:hypothetical protein